jgi:phage shock protein B
MWVFVVPLIVFISVVGPIWVVFHYVTVWKRMKAERREVSPEQQAEQREMVGTLKRRAEKLERRIETLETLLDAEVAEWRNRI